MSDSDQSHLLFRVATVEDWDVVNELLDCFEDGTTRELWLDGNEWVNHDGGLVNRGDSRLLVVVQLQEKGGISATLDFRHVHSFDVDFRREVTPAEASARDQNVWRVAFLSCVVEAEECIVALNERERIGRGPFIAEPIYYDIE